MRPKTTPYPKYALITEASVHDLKAVRELIEKYMITLNYND